MKSSRTKLRRAVERLQILGAPPVIDQVAVAKFMHAALTPRRIQLRRTKGWRKPANTVVVSRPSKWGNPFPLYKPTMEEYDNGTAMMDAMHGICITAEACVNKYRNFLRRDPDGRKICRQAKKELRGKNLACWCKPHAPCHADVLLEVANK